MGTAIKIGSTPAKPAAQDTAAPSAAPKISVGSKAAGARSDTWLGVGTHANTSVFEKPKPGDVRLGVGAINKGEAQIANLHPQITRIRVDPTILQLQDPKFESQDPEGFAAASKRRVELEHFVQLATQHGGRADLCLWDLPKGYRTSPVEMKQIAQRYANLVGQLVAASPDAKPGTFMVSAQNEPNRTKLSPDQVVNLYTDIDQSLQSALGPDFHKSVKLIAGEMTQGDQSAKWISAVVPKLAGRVDAFTFHVYMHPGETPQAYEGRLRLLRQEVDAAMPKGMAPPELLVTEYGVKGDHAPKQKSDSPGTIAVNGTKTPLRDSPEGGFLEAQALIAITHAGFSGAMRWGSNPGGPTPWNSWSMTASAGGKFAKKPAYYATQLFTTAVAPGWHPEQSVGGAAGENVATYRGAVGPGAAAVVANANTAPQKLRLGGFPPNAPVQLLVYNADGKGLLSTQRVRTDPEGFVSVSVPPHGVAAATTRLAPPVE